VKNDQVLKFDYVVVNEEYLKKLKGKAEESVYIESD
jgi:hypothetical protein